MKTNNWNWNKVLTERALHNLYKSNALPTVGRAANGWVTCAVGEQSKLIPRNEAGAPLDTELHMLALKFGSAIFVLVVSVHQNKGIITTEVVPSLTYARQILARIEERSKILIERSNVTKS